MNSATRKSRGRCIIGISIPCLPCGRQFDASSKKIFRCPRCLIIYVLSYNISKEDFIYSKVSENKRGNEYNLIRVSDKEPVCDCSKYNLINITSCSDAEVEALFRLVRAWYALFTFVCIGSPQGFLDYFKEKGEIYQMIKHNPINIQDIVTKYIQSGKEEDFSQIREIYAEHRKNELGISNRCEKDNFPFDKKNAVEELLKRLSNIEEIRQYCGELFDSVSKKVMGQTDTLKELIISLVSYVLDPNSQKSPLFVTGPTGCGKTYSIRLLSKEMGLPFVEIPTPSLSPASYKGSTISEVLFSSLSEQIKEHGGYPSRMIFYLDEFGKILQRGGDNNTSFSIQIQNEFLKLIEPGATLRESDRFINMKLPFNSLIVLSDALSFIKFENPHNDITRSDLVKAGFIPELAGRIQIVRPFRGLEIEDFELILNGGKNTILESKRATCDKMGISLEIEPDAVRKIAELAKTDGAGGRSLNHIVDTLVTRELNELIFDKTMMRDMIKINGQTIKRHFPTNGGTKSFGFKAAL